MRGGSIASRESDVTSHGCIFAAEPPSAATESQNCLIIIAVLDYLIRLEFDMAIEKAR
jgi:hypothetical protein